MAYSGGDPNSSSAAVTYSNENPEVLSDVPSVQVRDESKGSGGYEVVGVGSSGVAVDGAEMNAVHTGGGYSTEDGYEAPLVSAGTGADANSSWSEVDLD